ncbi:MAG TPA: HAD family hydrolase [Candidatus Deferrimicrobium sp.]|nr:HAD family hydrolase [Candidatus Deferrimicrobium sp.]
MKVKLVVFDYDQTLVDSGKGFEVAIKKTMDEFQLFLEAHGINIIVEDYIPQLKKKMRELDKNRQYDRDLWWNILLKEMGVTEIQFSIDECIKLTDLYWNITAEYTEFYPDTLEILNYLKEKKYKLGLLTDTDGRLGLKKNRLQKSGLFQYFDGIMIAGDLIPETKPDPAPFRKLASLLNIPPDASVMVGDKPFTDIKGGNAAGFYTILVLRENWEIDPVPDYQISNLIEIKSIL